MNGISSLPISLQKLLQETEYPPQRPTLLQSTTTKVVMIVDAVSPTPFALLRRANHFQYRDDDRALQEFAEYEDPVKALTDECSRVLRCISSANQSQASNSKNSTGLRDASWSRFEDIGFGGIEENVEEEGSFMKPQSQSQSLRTTPHYQNVGLARPTTPSWADFLSSGFVDEAKAGPAPLLLPPDKILPPIDTRGRSSQSHRPRLETEGTLEPGELASINRFDLDDSFWWVWITSLAGEETPERKAAFGRCALVETVIKGGRWLVMEEVVKGAAAEPEAGAYIAEKKSFWGRSRKSKTRRKSTGKEALEKHGALQPFKTGHSDGTSKVSVGPDQHARIQAAAIQLQQKQRQQEAEQQKGVRRGRADMEGGSQKTTSVFTLQPVIMSEASPAMKWASKYDKDAIREAYLANSNTGRGTPEPKAYTNGHSTKSQDTLRPAQNLQRDNSRDRDLPAVPSSKGPAVPSKQPSPPATSPPAPVARDSKEQPHLSEKAAEAALPADAHPAVAGPSLMPSAMPQATQPPIEQHPAVARSASPMPPTEQPSLDITRPSEDTRHGGSSPESKTKHNKLKKKELGGEPRGFRKIFGRKNRQSVVPEKAPEALNGAQGSLQPAQPGGIGRRLSHLRKKSPPATLSPSPTPSNQPPPSAPISENEVTPIASPQPPFERSYDPSVHESLSRVDTNDAREARQAFSNFDQGPLEDVPAFVPDSPSISEDSAAPPNISRSHQPEDTTSPLTQESSPPQDRWAQIRKNAAERAAVRQSEEQSHGGQSLKTDGDDGETSGEESKCFQCLYHVSSANEQPAIESRVARIKARVAELTGNMESNGSPTSQSPARKPAGY